MALKRTLLIAEDSEINRKILTRMLSSEYTVLTAKDGKEALEVLAANINRISAIILDIIMPVMDGFDVLQTMLYHPEYENIPVVVATGNADDGNETKALALGAWDFVSKPYKPDVIKFRLRNAIERSKLNMLEQLRHQAEHDPLTGLYNTRKFYQSVREMLDADPQGTYVMVRLDISRFRQFNSLYGTDAGDAFLKYIASLLPAFGSAEKCVYSHVDGDVFAICSSCEDKAAFMARVADIQAKIKAYNTKFDIVVVFGFYFLDDFSLSINEMLDRAAVAAKSCKGNYVNTVAEYTSQMEQAQEAEEIITNEMNIALERKDFCVYYQPKYNIATNTPCGAEALVRWKHPEKGIISPGTFIPVFEKTGFIAKVDYYIWELVCKDLKRWCDDGWNPAPVSVNISRVNLNNPAIVEIITDLVNRYGIEPRLLQLEITETAYMDNPEAMDRIVQRFHEKGFTILMDDFGSGYSSLNTLKEISVDILKVDMKFLPTGKNNAKCEKILACVIRMADWIGMPVIVEGVETQAQRDFLQSVGCVYVQGYYYAKPMPVDAYEALISQKQVFDHTPAKKQEIAQLDAMLSSDPKTEALLSGISVPVAIYEYVNYQYDRIRVNQSFYDIFGYQSTPDSPALRVPETEQVKISNTFLQVATTHASAECDVLFILANGEPTWYRVVLRYVMSSRNGHIICGVFTEISQEKKVEAEMARIVGILNRNEQSKKSLLIVDDSEITCSMLENLFKEEFQILLAKDGVEGLDLLRVHKNDIAIILLDIIMPKMDGSEFLAMKNHMDGAIEIPVIVISTDQRPDIQVDMLHSGVNDYITKPFIPEVVYRRVKNVLEYQSRFSALVHEFRQVISLSPSVSTNLDKAYLSLEEIRVMITFMRPIFDVVRIVDPTNTAIITIDDANQIHRAPYSCFRVWNKQTRCDNCTSACAMQADCQMTKYEFIENDIFYVVSRPIELILPNNQTERVILEIVSHVSDSLMSQVYNGISLRNMLESTRQKIYCDPLTSAYNRRYLYEMLFLHRGRIDIARKIAAVMMDMNHFKTINDTQGHAIGDRILVAVTKALQENVRDSDSVIRYGGDEFMIILTNCKPEHVPNIIKKLSVAIEKITYGKENEHHASAKFGYAYTKNFIATREFLDKMIDIADQDMYKNKQTLRAKHIENTSNGKQKERGINT